MNVKVLDFSMPHQIGLNCIWISISHFHSFLKNYWHDLAHILFDSIHIYMPVFISDV